MSDQAERVSEEAANDSQPKWRPLSPRQRRVAGVLVEKAKTTPDAYPMTLNSLRTGCNQKSNRHPQMELTEGEVEEALEELREMGAVGEVQGSGRALKYRHYLYDWLGVDKVEMAVMTELMLRGEQTIGELRGRAARMEPIADLAELKPILKSLIEKKLVRSLSPEGRGQVVTHGLHKDRELDSLQSRFDDAAVGQEESADADDDPVSPAPRAANPPSRAASPNQFELLHNELVALRQEVEQLKQRVETLEN